MADAGLTALTDASLTDEQQDFVHALRSFCAKEVTREVLDAYEEDHHSDEIAGRMAELGWWSLWIDESYGGSGGAFSDALLFAEETARGRAPIGGYGVTLIVTGILNRFGSDEQKRELLGRASAGGVLAIAMSESDAGSDVGSLKTRARREQDAWVITGTKMWCSYAHKASHIVVVCRSQDARDRHDGLTMLIVPRDSPGLTITPITTLAGNETNELHLDEVLVPEAAALGVAGAGWKQLMAGLNHERLIIAALALGLAQRAFDDTLAYVRSRRQFGRPVGSFQALQHRVAELATELTQARLLVRFVARLTDENEGRMLPREASMAKLTCTELAKRCVLEGVQMMGGYGLATEYPMERYLRTAMAMTIYGGTSEIQKNIIGRTLGL